MSFDYGATVAEKVNPYKLWPTTGELIALIDGDMIPYICGYTTDERRAGTAYASAKFLYGKEPDCDDWEWIQCMQKQPYFRDKVEHLDGIINEWVTGSGADAAKIFMTDSANNFRLDVAFTKPYKGQRQKGKPPFFYELRAYMIKMHNAIVSKTNEADDLMSIFQHKDVKGLVEQGAEIGTEPHKQFCGTVIVSKDKDLMIVPGWHYDPDSGDKVYVDTLGWLSPVMKERESVNYEYWPMFNKEALDPDDLIFELEKRDDGLYYEKATGNCQDIYTRGANKGKGKFKRIKKGFATVEYIDKLKGAGLKFFYSQLIVGDTVDNYPGIKGSGANLAFERLNNCKSEKELYYATLDLYKEQYSGGTSEPIWVENYRGGKALLSPLQLMVEQGRLAHMQTDHGEVWRAKNFCPSGVDPIWK